MEVGKESGLAVGAYNAESELQVHLLGALRFS